MSMLHSDVAIIGGGLMGHGRRCSGRRGRSVTSSRRVASASNRAASTSAISAYRAAIPVSSRCPCDRRNNGKAS